MAHVEDQSLPHSHPLHKEKHFTASNLIRDVVIGMADGLTVPFALAAGVSGATSNTRVIVIAGLAEIAAGSIAMGLGGYLAARGDAEHYDSERKREELEVIEKPRAEEEEIYEIFEKYGVSKEESAGVMGALRRNPGAWVDFMMRFELGLEKPAAARARTSATTIGVSYIAGGLVPLAPYMLLHNPHTGLIISVIITLIALGVFGFVKGRVTGQNPFKSGGQTALIGGIAAMAAFGLAKLCSVE